jgi:hypothetical protein
MAQWFQSPSAEFTSLVIARHASAADARVVGSVTLTDADAVHKLARRIEGIAPDGDEMMSFGPRAEHVTLTFSSPTAPPQRVDLYEKHFKTPSTSFHSVPSPAEAALAADVDALLSPDFGKKLLKVRGLALGFKTSSAQPKKHQNFTITWQGGQARDGAPATVSFVRETFLVSDVDGQEQTLTVVAGQLPPPPVSFQAGTVKATLLSYETKARDRLYPEYFQVSK